MQVSIPTIGNEKSYESHPEIRMHTIDVALSAVLNDRVKFLLFSKTESYNLR